MNFIPFTSFRLKAKLMQYYFVTSDNVIDKKLEKYVEKQEFANRNKVNNLIKDIILFYAQNFTEGNYEKARDVLEHHNKTVRTKDAMLMAFYGGIISIIALVILTMVILPS